MFPGVHGCRDATRDHHTQMARPAGEIADVCSKAAGEGHPVIGPPLSADFEQTVRARLVPSRAEPSRQCVTQVRAHFSCELQTHVCTQNHLWHLETP